MANREIELIRDALRERGVSQKDLADWMHWPPSAVSNLLKGKRALKVGEARRIAVFLDLRDLRGSEGRALPVVRLKDLAHLDRALADSGATYDYYGDAGESAFVIIDVEPRLSVERFRHFYAVIDPADKSLFNNGGYAIVDGAGAARLVAFKTDPARYESFWDPSWDGGGQEIGAFEHRLVGAIKEVGWRPELEAMSDLGIEIQNGP